jgi:hypothetical protein
MKGASSQRDGKPVYMSCMMDRLMVSMENLEKVPIYSQLPKILTPAAADNCKHQNRHEFKKLSDEPAENQTSQIPKPYYLKRSYTTVFRNHTIQK